MNIISRGIRNAFRNMIRSGSIIVILSLSIGLIISMLAARQAVASRIESVKSSVGNTVSISPAGVRGFDGGGTALTTAELAKVKTLQHVSSVSSELTDRLTTDTTTSLTSSVELGALGQRRATQNQSANNSESSSTNETRPEGAPSGGQSFNPRASVTITGIEDTTSQTVFGGTKVTWTSGAVFNGTQDKDVAVVGASLATKNNLKVGSTFTAYGTSITVVGIYDAGNTFANNGVFTSLSTLQRLSSQADSVTSATAKIDSLDNLSTATTAITAALGSAADVTNNQDTTSTAVAPLESVKTISFFSLVGALVAGAVVILLTMIMIVRERRREIGVMKAIGASNIGIVAQFVVEAVTLTTVALVIGLAVGIAASTPLTNTLVTTSSSSTSTAQTAGGQGARQGGARGFGRSSTQVINNLKSSVGAETIGYGIGATLLIAILGSALPAFLISKIKPAEAMRSE